MVPLGGEVVSCERGTPVGPYGGACPFIRVPPPPHTTNPWGRDSLNYFTEMCSGSEAGSYFRLIDFLYHSTLGLRVIKKKQKYEKEGPI